MEKYDPLLRLLSSPNRAVAENAYNLIIEHIHGDIMGGNEMAAATQALSGMINGNEISEQALLLLAAIAEKGIDITPAVDALESAMRLPPDKGQYRRAAVRALNLHYCNAGLEELPVPLPEYMVVESWRLAGCSRRPLYSDPDMHESSPGQSSLHCACCGSQDTLSTFDGKAAGGGPSTRELLCRKCGVYSIYTAAHTFD